MASKHNIAAAIALVLLSLFPLFAFRYSVAESENGSDQPVYEVIAQWPNAPRQAALELIDAYGPPDEAKSDALVWHRTEPWQHTIVYRLDSGEPGGAPDVSGTPSESGRVTETVLTSQK